MGCGGAHRHVIRCIHTGYLKTPVPFNSIVNRTSWNTKKYLLCRIITAYKISETTFEQNANNITEIYLPSSMTSGRRTAGPGEVTDAGLEIIMDLHLCTPQKMVSSLHSSQQNKTLSLLFFRIPSHTSLDLYHPPTLPSQSLLPPSPSSAPHHKTYFIWGVWDVRHRSLPFSSIFFFFFISLDAWQHVHGSLRLLSLHPSPLPFLPFKYGNFFKIIFSNGIFTIFSVYSWNLPNTIQLLFKLKKNPSKWQFQLCLKRARAHTYIHIFRLTFV